MWRRHCQTLRVHEKEPLTTTFTTRKQRNICSALVSNKGFLNICNGSILFFSILFYWCIVVWSTLFILYSILLAKG